MCNLSNSMSAINSQMPKPSLVTNSKIMIYKMYKIILPSPVFSHKRSQLYIQYDYD